VRLIPIDFLRAVAVFVVMFRHIALGKDNAGLVGLVARLEATPVDLAHLHLLVIRSLYGCGWAGVDLFFVLSGYLVSGLLFREYLKHQDLRVGRFLFRRGLKIYPAFYVFLAIGALGMAVAHANRPFVAWLCEALFIQNYGANIWGHTWSLAVEEHFYIALALLLYGLAKRGGPNPFRALPWIFVAVTLSVTTARVLTAIAHPVLDHKTHYFPTHLRVDALFFGVLLSYLQHFAPQRLAFVKTHGRAVVLVSALLVAPTLFFNQLSMPMYVVFLPALYVGCGGLLLSAIASARFTQAPFTYVTRPMAFVGVHSYSIYLWHAAVLVIGVPLVARVLRAAHLGPMDWLGEATVYVVGCIVVGIGMAKLIELPVLRVRDRTMPDRAR
jgi:peptidoglycan/LPS O-acetylase OafA/YrhL